MEEDQKRKKNQPLLTEEDEEDDHVRRMKEILEVEKAPDKINDFNDTMSSHYNFVVDNAIVKATCKFGYPKDYVIK